MAEKTTRKRRRARQKEHRKIRKQSRKLVNSGQIPERPCLVCGSKQDLTVHHMEPIRANRFVFLCLPCHVRAHQPLYRKMSVPLAYGQFSIRPEAAVMRKGVPRG